LRGIGRMALYVDETAGDSSTKHLTGAN